MGNRFPEKWKLGKNPIMFQHFKEVMARPKDAAIYVTPSEIEAEVRKLVGDPVAYEAQVMRAWEIVENKFSFERHYSRLGLLPLRSKAVSS